MQSSNWQTLVNDWLQFGWPDLLEGLLAEIGILSGKDNYRSRNQGWGKILYLVLGILSLNLIPGICAATNIGWYHFISNWELLFSGKICLARIQHGECPYRALEGVKTDPDFLGNNSETFINSLRETLCTQPTIHYQESIEKKGSMIWTNIYVSIYLSQCYLSTKPGDNPNIQ